MEYVIIFVMGVLATIGISFVCTIPEFLLWNWLTPIYFDNLPLKFQHIPFLHMWGFVCLMFCIGTNFKSYSYSPKE